MAVAIVTGASRGLGLALARALSEPLPGDVSSEGHRRALIRAAISLGRLDLLVDNASVLGPSPQPPLADYDLEPLERVFSVNVFSPLRLIQLPLPLLRASGGRILNITSDAAVEGYPGWGGYGSSKAALEQLSRVLAAEHPELRIYWADPGDMRTQMHQEAFPGEHISDRPPPEASVPGLMRLIEGDLPSGRYRTADLSEATGRDHPGGPAPVRLRPPARARSEGATRGARVGPRPGPLARCLPEPGPPRPRAVP